MIILFCIAGSNENIFVGAVGRDSGIQQIVPIYMTLVLFLNAILMEKECGKHLVVKIKKVLMN